MPAARRKGARSKAETAGKGVYFLSLTVENVRCFKDKQTLDLSDGKGRPARWTVLLGENNTGKTTLLQALALGLTDLAPEGPGYAVAAGRLWYAFWLRRSEAKDEDDALLDIRGTLGEALGSSGSAPESFSRRIRVVPPSNPVLQELPSTIGNMLVAGYGAARRLRDRDLASPYSNDDPLLSLFSDDAPLRDADRWLLNLDHGARQNSPQAQQFAERFEQVCRTLVELLPEVSAFRVSPPPRPGYQGLVIEAETPDGWVPFRALAAGYRAQIAWTVDFASRLFDRWPDSPNPLAEPAICLVDELDLHMHPKWQRAIVGRLTELFPNTQFVVTAHSPLIVQAAEDAVPGEAANLVLLRREGDHVVIDNDPVSVRNWRVDQILTSELFGLASARPPRVEKLLEERRAILRSAARAPTDQRRLEDLERQIGDLPSDRAPADEEAMAIIREAAARLRAKA